MRLTKTTLNAAFAFHINQNLAQLKQRLRSNKNGHCEFFSTNQCSFRSFPPDKGFHIAEAKLRFMIGKFFAPRLPPSLTERGSEMHLGPVFMPNRCHQNNGSYYTKILCKWAIMGVNDNLVRPCSGILLWSEILLIFLKHGTKYTWQILGETVPVARLCGEPARSRARPAAKRGTAGSEARTDAEPQVRQLLEIRSRVKDLSARLLFPKTS